MAQPQETSITFFGQSGFKIVSPYGKVVLIDPYFKNPLNPNGAEALAKEAKETDLLLLTHGHFDHSSEIVEIGNLSGAALIAPAILGEIMVEKLGFPEKNGVKTGQVGETIVALNGDLQVTFTKAVHGSSINVPGSEEPVESGESTGIILNFKNGPIIYHSGDTALFDEMTKIAEPGEIDIYMVCMGGHYTMDPIEAAEAVSRIQPNAVIPMHYATYPPLKGTPEELIAAMKELELDQPVLTLEIGESLTIE